MPTLSLSNTICLKHLADAETEYPRVRIFATLGWIVAGLSISYIFDFDTSANQCYVAAGAAFSVGIYSFFLPKTPPPAKGEKVNFGDMIGAGTLSGLAAFLCDEAIDEIFVGGKAPKAAGVAFPSGIATPVEGGYRVTGKWAFASGIRHSEWLAFAAMVDDGTPEPSQMVRVVIPTSEVQIHDNWHVVGLRGTGSCEFSVSDVFVPQRFTWGGPEAKPFRGGPNFLLGRPGMQTTGHAGFALGVGRRALDEVTDLAQNKKRGYRGTQALVADRGSFQRFLGESDLRLRAAKALCVETIEEAWESVCRGITPPSTLQIRLRASGTYSTEEASDIVSQAFRFGGGSAMYSSHILQKCLRDIHGAAQHNMVSDRAYENHGQFMLGFPDANPMG